MITLESEGWIGGCLGTSKTSGGTRKGDSLQEERRKGLVRVDSCVFRNSWPAGSI